MLLDELLAERERPPAEPTPPPTLTVDPVSVPPTSETGRRAVRQRLAELESAAQRNFRSAEEARHALAEEHQRLQLEANARTEAQHEADALRRELDRLSTKETRRAAQERARARRAARSELADELKRFEEERERVMREMAELRGSITEHDGLLAEYVTRLRDEQVARAELRMELERAQAAQSLAERNLERATESARHNAEDEIIRLATAEQQLADATSDRDRLATQLAELTAGDGAIGRMTAAAEEKDAEIKRLGVRVADLEARIGASEEAAQNALAERDDAWSARSGVEAELAVAEQACADAERALELAQLRIGELESELAEHIETTDVRTRELDAALGKLRREAREATSARRAAEEARAGVETERDTLLARVAGLEEAVARARADGDSLRAHATVVGDELAAARAQAEELRAAAPNAAPDAEPVAIPTEPSLDDEAAAPPAADSPQSELPQGDLPPAEVPPPLPARVAGRHAPAPLARRRTRREPAVARAAAEAPPDAAEPEPVAAEAEQAEAAPPARPGPTEAFRRTALAEFTALATSNGDDFSFRRR